MIDGLEGKENYKVMFFDEGRFGLRSTTMRIWSEKGKRLRVNVQQGFKNFYAYSAVCPFDGDSFSLILPNVNTDNFNIFLSGLSAHCADIKLILIMDQAGWHKSKELIACKNIDIIYLPPYSPELNPVEKLWEWLKKEMAHNFMYESLDQMIDAICIEYNKLDNQKLKKLCNCNYLSYIK